MRIRLLILTLAVALTASAQTKFQYPQTKKVDQKDTYAGNVVVADPYRWLEDTDSPETKHWAEAENAGNRSGKRMCPPRNARRHSKPSRKRWPVRRVFNPREARRRSRVGT